MSRALQFLTSLVDPRNYLHAFRLLHYHSYSHVAPRARMTVGEGTGIAPTTSLRNGERITIGRQCHIGEGAFLWAGDGSGTIELGDRVSIAPNVFITASDYRFVRGRPFREQPKRERPVRVGNDVWLGAGVVVTAGVTIGDGCIVGAGAVVTRDLPEGSIAAGVPARVIGEREDAQDEFSPQEP